MIIKVVFRLSSVLAVVAVLALAGCGGDTQQSGTQQDFPGAGMGMGQQAAIPVQVAPVVRGNISTFLMYTSTVEAEREVDVVAKVAGQVVQLPSEEGLRVRKGQLLAQLDEAELKIDLMQAQARMETDKAAYERAKNMLEKNLISAENFETARLQYESSKATYEAARLRVEYTSIRSPIDGIVTARNIELGQRVNVNQVLFRIADFTPLRVRIYVPEKDMKKIYEGQKAVVTADAIPNETFEGVVRMISPIVDPTNGTVKVTIDINNPKNQLKPGMFASVHITTDSHENTLLIPKKALLLESQTDQVFVYDNGIARKRTLKLGFVSGDTAEVLEGLQEGELVVVIGQEGLREGLPIRIPGQQITQAPTDSAAGQRRERPAAMADNIGRASRPTADQPGRQSNGQSDSQFDPKVLARLEAMLQENRFMQRMYERAVQEDPAIATDPAKKFAYFNAMVQRFEERALQNPEMQAAFAKKVKEDPEFEHDLAKKLAFFMEAFRNMRGGRGRQ